MHNEQKLAILVIGKSGAGKTTTWRELLGKSKDYRLHVKFWDIIVDNSFSELKLTAFIQGSSPTERNKSLEDLLKEKTETNPRILLCSEQSIRKYKSKNHLRLAETIGFLQRENYKIEIIWITEEKAGSEDIEEKKSVEDNTCSLKHLHFKRDDDKRIGKIQELLRQYISKTIQ